MGWYFLIPHQFFFYTLNLFADRNRLGRADPERSRLNWTRFRISEIVTLPRIVARQLKEFVNLSRNFEIDTPEYGSACVRLDIFQFKSQNLYI